jgi:drug/metabolite transporter (DMT)-like permease
MLRLLGVPLSILTTAVCWGTYGVVLRWGAQDMGESRLRSFVCVGLAYFVIAVVVPFLMMKTTTEKGSWSFTGTIWSFIAGVLGALGALGIVLALTSGGTPLFVMPLVFGGAPVINTFTTMVMTKNFKMNPVFLAGLILVIAGAVCVLLFGTPKGAEDINRNLLMIIGSILLTVFTWGAYGPTLHKGQMLMQGSRLRPLICVGLAYFVIAVLIAGALYPVMEPTGAGGHGAGYAWTFSGFWWSFLAGSAGAIGALGIIMAFNFGGKPVYVMPLVFGGAPIVNTFVSLWMRKVNVSDLSPIFFAGLMMSIIGAATVLIFAPKGAPHAPAKPVEETPPSVSKSETT